MNLGGTCMNLGGTCTTHLWYGKMRAAEMGAWRHGMDAFERYGL
jgi:hypothetical protein